LDSNITYILIRNKHIASNLKSKLFVLK